MSPDLLQVIGLVIEFSTLPQLPDDAQPTVRQAAVGVALGVTSGQAAALLLARLVSYPESPRAPSPLCEGAFFFPETGVKVRYLVGKVRDTAPKLTFS